MLCYNLSMDTADDAIDQDLIESSSRMPPQDENGVDLWQIRDHLSLTPAERLTRLEQFIEFVQATRRFNGIE